MGNILRGFIKKEEDHADYLPISRPHYQPQYYSDEQPAAAPRPRPRPQQQPLGPHGSTSTTAGVTARAQGPVNLKEEDHADYLPISRPHYQLQYYSDEQPIAAPRPSGYCSSSTLKPPIQRIWIARPQPQQQALGPHGGTSATAGVTALAQGPVNSKEEDHADYHPISRPHYQPQYYSDEQPAAAPRPSGYCSSSALKPPIQRIWIARPQPQQQALGPHGGTSATASVTALAQGPVNSAGGPNIGNLQRSSEVCAAEVLAPGCRCNTKDIDESSAQELCDAVSYAKANAMLIQVPVLGTMKKFWRLSDKATRISRKLALILKSHHAVRKYLTAPLQVSNVWISNTGSVKLRGVSFTGKHFSIERVRGDYEHLSRVLLVLIHISGGDISKLPSDYKEFIRLLMRDTLTMQDEFLIVNNSALLPMKNRTEVFLMLCDKINKSLGRTKAGQVKRKMILSKLPYENDWLDTAIANTQIKQWVVNVQNQYERTQYDQLRLNRNVRSHMHDYNDDDIEEILYCEWPELLMEMVKMLHAEGELVGTDIQNKFG